MVFGKEQSLRPVPACHYREPAVVTVLGVRFPLAVPVLRHVSAQATSEEITRQPAICRNSLDESLIEFLSLPAEARSSERILRLHFLTPAPSTQATVRAQPVFPGICGN